MLSVDVEEADVAVLTQDLARSKELFTDILRLLRTITTKTSTASRSIKPVLAEFNTLTAKKKSVDDGLQLLKNVSVYSLQAADAQRILQSPIENVGVNKYLDTLNSLAELVRLMKRDIRDFDGVVVGFANVVDKAEMAVVIHFGRILQAVDLSTGTFTKQNDAAAVLAYFATRGNLRGAYEAVENALGRQLASRMAPFESACAIQKRQSNIPYEKGATGIATFVKELTGAASSLDSVCSTLKISDSAVVKNTVTGYIDKRVTGMIAGYGTFADQNGLVSNDFAILDVLDQLDDLSTQLDPKYNLAACPLASQEHRKLVTKAQGLLKEWVRFVDTRVSLVDRYNEHSIPEVVVEVVSRIRRIAEFDSISLLMADAKLGGWLDVKPPLQFISVYTSVVPGAEASAPDRTAFLVLSYLLDLFDELMVNIEVNLKEQSGDNGMKKLSQGFLLVKNVVMIETIVNRLEPLYNKLGLTGMERLQRLKNRFLKLFLDDWNYASYIIIRDMTQITTTNAMHGGQNLTKEKDQIKELFKNFNESFEEALRNYDKFNIQEKNLRNYLANEIKKLILNAYNKLYDKYGAGDFTKNKSKYVKYDKLQFERLLNEKL